jgi:hypothetical protein
MATVNNILITNPHREAFGSIIKYLNANQNPFESALAANYIYTRLTYWGSGSMPIEPPPDFSAPSGVGAVINSVNYQTSPEIARSVIKLAAVDAGADAAETAPLVAFRRYLDGIAMNTANAWIDFNHAINVFYEIIDPINYFMVDYSLGSYSTKFLAMLGLYKRKGSAGNGIKISVITEGDLLVPGIKEITKIDFRSVIVSELTGRWFAIYNQLGQMYVFYYNIDGSGVAPGVPGSFLETQITIADSSTTSKISALGRTLDIINGIAHFTSLGITDEYGLIQLNTPFNANAPLNGTAGGYDGAVTSMLASDGSLITAGIGVDDFVTWQSNNNTLRAVYDAAFEQNIYIESIYTNTVFEEDKATSTHNVYRFFQHDIEIAGMTYNASGVTFINKNTVRDIDL